MLFPPLNNYFTLNLYKLSQLHYIYLQTICVYLQDSAFRVKSF